MDDSAPLNSAKHVSSAVLASEPETRSVFWHTCEGHSTFDGLAAEKDPTLRRDFPRLPTRAWLRVKASKLPSADRAEGNFATGLCAEGKFATAGSLAKALGGLAKNKDVSWRRGLGLSCQRISCKRA